MDDVTGTFFLCLSNMARTFEMHARLFRNNQVKDLKRWGSCASYLFVWFCFYHFLTLSVFYLNGRTGTWNLFAERCQKKRHPASRA